MDNPVTVRLVRGVTPPTAPSMETVPAVPPFKLSATPPLRVLVKLMFAPNGDPPPLVVSKEVAVKVVGPAIVIAPLLVVIFPFTLIDVDPV